MHCAACAFTIEDALRRVPGVCAASVNAATHRASVTWREDQVQPSVWMQAIAAAGYQAVPAQDHSLRQARLLETRRMMWRLLVAAFCMMQVMMYATPAYVTEPGEISANTLQLLRWASWVLTLPVVVFSCMPFWRNAVRDLLTRRLSMDLPVALGMGITFIVSTAGTFDPEGPFGAEVYFDSLTMFVFFLLGGRWLEWRLRDQTAGALEALMNRLPESVERQMAQGWERVALHRLRMGDVVRVRAGESFPGDGVIVQGQTLVEEAMLTGESRPCARGPNEAVMAGSHNVSAAGGGAHALCPTGRVDRASCTEQTAHRTVGRSLGASFLVGGVVVGRGGGLVLVAPRSSSRFDGCGVGVDRHLPMCAVTRHPGRHARQCGSFGAYGGHGA
jgi:Cu2+-exporting ATPase